SQSWSRISAICDWIPRARRSRECITLLRILRQHVRVAADAFIADVDGRSRDQLADLILTLPTEGARQNQRLVLPLCTRPLYHLHALDRPLGCDRQSLIVLQLPADPLELSQLVLRRLPGRHRLSKELLLLRDESLPRIAGPLPREATAGELFAYRTSARQVPSSARRFSEGRD